MPVRASRPSAYAFRWTSSYLIERHSRSMKMLSMKRPRPSIEIAILAASSLPVNAALVNCAPWSVLNIRGLPYRCRASSSASTQNALSIVFDSRQAHRAAGPVDDRYQIQKAAGHWNVGDVRRPYVVRLDDRHAAQQVGVDLVARRGLARARTRNQPFEPHQAHQPLHPLAIDPATFLVEIERHPARAVERLLQIQLVDPAHQSQIVGGSLGPGPIDPRARHVQQRALPPHRQLRPASLDLRASRRRAHRLGLLAKKSRSTVSSPILL